MYYLKFYLIEFWLIGALKHASRDKQKISHFRDFMDLEDFGRI
jgi:hypothetical protein